MPVKPEIQIVSAPSILGLVPGGVENLGRALLECGLSERIGATTEVIHVPTLNELYSPVRDTETGCLNLRLIHDFSIRLGEVMYEVVKQEKFPVVLGGDCSILTGILPALKMHGSHGLVFIDGHADFYEPLRSTTGQLADMDLALVTGRGPSLITDIGRQRPYVEDHNVIHIGQRDQEETARYGSQEIRETAIRCFSMDEINSAGMETVLEKVLARIQAMPAKKLWIHLDTDVLSDDLNPAVDYRLPGGMHYGQLELLLGKLLASGDMAGMSITIYNADLDPDGSIARSISESLGRIFHSWL